MSSYRKEAPPLLARAVSNRRRQRTNNNNSSNATIAAPTSSSTIIANTTNNKSLNNKTQLSLSQLSLNSADAQQQPQMASLTTNSSIPPKVEPQQQGHVLVRSALSSSSSPPITTTTPSTSTTSPIIFSTTTATTAKRTAPPIEEETSQRGTVAPPSFLRKTLSESRLLVQTPHSATRTPTTPPILLKTPEATSTIHYNNNNTTNNNNTNTAIMSKSQHQKLWTTPPPTQQSRLVGALKDPPSSGIGSSNASSKSTTTTTDISAATATWMQHQSNPGLRKQSTTQSNNPIKSTTIHTPAAATTNLVHSIGSSQPVRTDPNPLFFIPDGHHGETQSTTMNGVVSASGKRSKKSATTTHRTMRSSSKAIQSSSTAINNVFHSEASHDYHLLTGPRQQQQRQPQPASSSPRKRQCDNLNDKTFQDETNHEPDDVDKGIPDNHVVNDDEDGDEVHDVEPILGTELVDASCLTSGAVICIRSASPVGMFVSVNHHDDDSEVVDTTIDSISQKNLASLQGMGLGREKDLFQLHSINNYDPTTRGDDENQILFRYGDIVTITCPAVAGKALGVKVVDNQSGENERNANALIKNIRSRYQVGCFDTHGSADQWSILCASPRQRPLWVGPAALKARPSHTGTTTEGGLVRVGDYVVLRHCATGGLLSLTDDGHDSSMYLTLLTDSYSVASQRQTQMQANHHQNGSQHHTKSLLDLLQQHDRMFPTDYQTFQLIPFTNPPRPHWARHGLLFHSGSYLHTPQRHDSLSMGGSTKTGGERGVNASTGISVECQEKFVLDEVIGSMIGLEGRHVRIHYPGDGVPNTDDMEFRLVDSPDVTFHLSLRRLVERILPLSTAFVQVRAFVVRHSTELVYGRVMQALCEAMDGLLQDHICFVNTNLDQRFQRELRCVASESVNPTLLSVKQLYALVQPAFESLLTLQAVCTQVKDKNGGSLLNEVSRLRKQIFAGDWNAQRLIDQLLDKASAPYMDLLRSWLQSGMLDDPYEEFCIQRGEVEVGLSQHLDYDPGYNGDTWNEIYSIRNKHILLDFISSESTRQKLLRTGKYWNAVGAAGRLDESMTKQDVVLELSFHMDSITFLSFIDSMYQLASHALVRLIRNDFNLFETMRTLKRYFLLDQGDFFVNFLDTAEVELSKQASQVSMGQIQHWLGMTIQLCETTTDGVLHVATTRLDKPVASPLIPHLLRCRMASESLSEHLKSLHGQGNRRDSIDSLVVMPSLGAVSPGLTGVEAFMLAFPTIPFPTSLVISPRTVASYQLLFRHLFIAKHIERRLVGVWRDQQVMKAIEPIHASLGPSMFLGHRMLHFSQNLVYYMMFEVIEPNWSEMCKNIFGNQGEQTLDNIIDCHTHFLRLTLDACLLTNYEFVRILSKLMNTCLRFTDLMKHFVNLTGVHDDQKKIANDKRATFARNMNGPQGATTKKALHDALISAKEDCQKLVSMQTRRVLKEASDSKFRKAVARLECMFSKNLSEFMQLLRSDMGDLYHAHRLNLSIHLDYNGYVTKSIDINTS